DGNYNGSDSFKFTVTDTGDPAGCSGSAPACDAALTPTEVTVPITVTPINDRPTAAATPSSLTLNEDGSSSVSVSGSDVETAASNLVFKSTAAPAHGTLTNGATVLATNDTFTGSPKSLGYSPDGNYHGSDRLKVTVIHNGDPTVCAR